MPIPPLRCEHCQSVWFLRAEQPAADSPHPQYRPRLSFMMICSHCQRKYMWNFTKQGWDLILDKINMDVLIDHYSRPRERGRS